MTDVSPLLVAAKALLADVERLGLWPLGPDNQPVRCGDGVDVEDIMSVIAIREAIKNEECKA